MNQTINISLPKQLKSQADSLIKAGIYASFSDLARTAIRKVVTVSKYDLWTEEAKAEYARGETKALTNEKEIDDFVNSLMPK